VPETLTNVTNKSPKREIKAFFEH